MWIILLKKQKKEVIMSKDISINSNIEKKEYDKVSKELSKAVEKLQENPEEFLKTLKPFTL